MTTHPTNAVTPAMVLCGKPYWLELILLIALVFAAWQAWNIVYDIDWPPGDDFYRDMGATQGILDGYASEDALYLGETRWYNPLVPSLMAGLHSWLNLALETLYSRLGPLLNLLAPIGLYLLVAGLANRKIALLAALAFLFVRSTGLPANTEGGYSPWFWARNFMQGPFFFCAFFLHHAYRSLNRKNTVTCSMIAGALLGITFLGHAAPAIILVIVTFALAGSIWLTPSTHSPKLRATLLLFVTGICSFVVCAPFLYSIYQAYGFHTLNPAPAQYIGLSLKEMLFGATSLKMGISLLGLLSIVLGNNMVKKWCGDRRELLIFILAPAVPLAWGIADQGFRKMSGSSLPLIVPTYHFHIYFTGLQSISFAIGLLLITNTAISVFYKNIQRTTQLAMALAILLTLSAIPFRQYSHEFTTLREKAQAKSAQSSRIELYQWLLNNTEPLDVMLCDDNTARYAVSPAGRKVVSTIAVYSNPYIDFESRRQDRDQCIRLLNSNDLENYDRLSQKYRIRYIIQHHNNKTEPKVPALSKNSFKRIFDNKNFAVFKRL